MNSNVSGSGDVKKIIVIFNFKQRILSLDMKTKVVQHVPGINFTQLAILIFEFKFLNFQILSGSQLLSDFQTFFPLENVHWSFCGERFINLEDIVKHDKLIHAEPTTLIKQVFNWGKDVSSCD